MTQSRKNGLKKGKDTAGAEPEAVVKHQPTELAVFDEDFMAISKVPDAGTDASIKALAENVPQWVRDRLEARDRPTWDEIVQDLDVLRTLPQPVARRISRVFDDLIFEQILILGPRFLLQRLVLDRMFQWWLVELHGVTLFERFGKALVLGAQIIRGEKKRPLDPKMRELSKDVKAEIKLLKNWLCSRQASQCTGFTSEELLDLTASHIGNNPRQFGRLRALWTPFCKYVKQEPSLLLGLVNGGSHPMTPAVFAVSFLSWSTNRDQESLRQALSKF